MNATIHSHKLILSRQIIQFVIGLVFTLLSILLALAGLLSTTSGTGKIIIIAISVINTLSTLPFGVMLLSSSFITKVIVAPDFVEYHLPALVMSTKWENLKRFEIQKSGKTHSVIVPTDGIVTVRLWVNIVHWLFRKDPTSFRIDTSQFSNSNGHSLHTDFASRISLSE